MANYFDSMYDLEGLRADAKKAEDENKKEYKDVPFGTYEVYIPVENSSGKSNFEKYEKGIRALAYITRDIESPIIVLPKEHPASKRLKMVLSVGENVRLDCGIRPGTHPEQDILCSCDSLSGLNIIKSKDGVIIEGEVKNYKIEPF